MDHARDILDAAARFGDAGDVFDVVMLVQTEPIPIGIPEHEWSDEVTVLIETDDGHLVLRKTLPEDKMAGWIDAIADTLRLPNAGDLAPDEWDETARLIVQHRRSLDRLPISER